MCALASKVREVIMLACLASNGRKANAAKTLGVSGRHLPEDPRVGIV
jgi:hypothetical protein